MMINAAQRYLPLPDTQYFNQNETYKVIMHAIPGKIQNINYLCQKLLHI